MRDEPDVGPVALREAFHLAQNLRNVLGLGHCRRALVLDFVVGVDAETADAVAADSSFRRLQDPIDRRRLVIGADQVEVLFQPSDRDAQIAFAHARRRTLPERHAGVLFGQFRYVLFRRVLEAAHGEAPAVLLRHVDHDGVDELGLAGSGNARDHGQFALSYGHKLIQGGEACRERTLRPVAEQCDGLALEGAGVVQALDRIGPGILDDLAQHLRPVLNQTLVGIFDQGVVAIRPCHPPATLTTETTGQLFLEGTTGVVAVDSQDKFLDLG